MDFSANASRPVDIRGRLRVRKGAHLNNSLIICTDARIEGQVTGTLLCEHHLELLGSGKLSFKATSETTLVGHKAVMELAYPLKTQALEVNGCLTGQIYCTGNVRIHKGGILRGSLEARSLAVDRGGTCEALTKIVSSPAPEKLLG
jgi:cytoskeletal protein CcmA (bactofilin family)